MANRRKSSVKYNTREEVVSSDLNRNQQMVSREFLNERVTRNYSDSWYNMISGDPNLAQKPPTPRAYLIDEPTADLSAVDFSITVGAGEAHQPASGGGVDEPAMLLHRWAQTILVHDAPDPNPRIDIIISTPGETETDAQTRTILQNPTTGVTAPATVNKTINPLATLSIVKGTAAANPIPPVVPSGSLGLFAVFVRSGATQAVDFGCVRMTNRSAIEVMKTYHGFMDAYTYVSTNTDIGFGGGPFGSGRELLRAIIDGELVVGTPPSSGGTPNAAVADTLNNPFGAAAGAFDRPYDIYIVGGSQAPNEVIVAESFIGGSIPGFSATPFQIVESLTPPDADGRPTAPIATTWGTTQRAAIFAGFGWTEQGSTNRKGVRMTADGWIESRGSSAGGYGNIDSNSWPVFDEIEGGGGGSRTPIPAASTTQAYSLRTAPDLPNTNAAWQNGRKARIISAVTVAGGGNGELLTWGEGSEGRRITRHTFFNTGPGSIMNEFKHWEVQLGNGSPPTIQLSRGPAGAGVTIVEALATHYWCPVRRLSSPS